MVTLCRRITQVYFISSNSITTCVFAWMLWHRPVGMWTQVTGCVPRCRRPASARLTLEEVQDGGH